MMPGSYRPSSITALTILHIIAGIIDSIIGLLLLLAYLQPSSFASIIGIPFPFILPAMGAIWVTFGILAFVIALSMWKGKRWSWLLGIILATDALVLGGFGMLLGSILIILPLVIYVVILIFLSMSKVRAYFGQTNMPYAPFFPSVPAAWVAPPPLPTVPAYGSSTYGPVFQQPSGTRPLPPAQRLAGWGTPVTCPSCGASLQTDTSYCFACGLRFR